MSASIASAARPETLNNGTAGLPRRQLWAYALPGLVTAIPTIPVFTLLPAFYAGHVGLGLALTGLLLFAGRLLDVLSDPLVGWLADRDGGRQLPRLILLGTLIAAPALVMLLSPPADAGPLLGGAWLLTGSALLYLGWTLIQIPYLTWGARLSDGYHQRTRITTAREGAVLVGILLSGSLPAVLGAFGATEPQSLAGLAWLAVGLGVPVFWLMLRRLPTPPPQRPARTSWRGLSQNRLFVRLLSAWFLNGLAGGAAAVLFPLYCAHVLQVNDQTRNLLLALYFASAVAGIPLWLALSRRLSRHRTWSLSMVIACPAFAFAALLEPGQWPSFAVICVVTGLCLGADLALPPAIQADVADWDRLRFRRNRTAALFSLWNVAAKLALAFAALVVLTVLGALGLDGAGPESASQQQVPQQAVFALALIYALPACVFKLSAVALVYDLPLTPARQALIAARLQRRDRSATEASDDEKTDSTLDPIPGRTADGRPA